MVCTCVFVDFNLFQDASGRPGQVVQSAAGGRGGGDQGERRVPDGPPPPLPARDVG